MPTKSLTEKLENYRLLIFNSQDEQITELLDLMGVDLPYLQRGQSLYEEVRLLVDEQKKQYQEQSLAYDQFYVEKDNAENAYKRTLKLVKILSRKDQNLQNRLGLNSARVQRIELWIERAIEFYNALLNETDFLNTLTAFKVTSEQLTAEKESITNLRELRNQAIIEKGQAQEATRLRNEKLDELDDYCLELKAIAELALEERPQLLEKLGVLVPS